MKIKIPWKTIESWPADGKRRVIPHIGLTALHLPATTMRCELLLVDDGDYQLRRIRTIRGWSNPDRITPI
ncbi:hypothetical protein LCGC14_2188320 [marine sediment metagenome]|uniref:Uncharacterized protein n=1 Tax=marine sediment metagenome TaxID=412755 RepID=A0A0F9FXP3_9ZZZZ